MTTGWLLDAGARVTLWYKVLRSKMMSEERSHFSFRLDRGSRQRLRDAARARRVSESDLARQYVTEGVRLERHPRITFTEHLTGRRAALRTRPRLDVRYVVDTWLGSERDERETAEYFEVEPADVAAALAYYREFSEEIDAERSEADDLAEGERAAWLRGRGEPS